ncbi:hypothetical protein E3N88_13772 [Mikania micrantha]|uniref:Uncharacterized protein n=1 Tax=Mikania micrantha TaxID=192012 RepID=A0A5N6NZW7_9ASTR|nr:hypothetical protein E3N88_13772 [Mikania micrantha]
MISQTPTSFWIPAIVILFLKFLPGSDTNYEPCLVIVQTCGKSEEKCFLGNPYIGSYLGTEFGYSWMQDSEQFDRRNRSIEQQYERGPSRYAKSPKYLRTPDFFAVREVFFCPASRHPDVQIELRFDSTTPDRRFHPRTSFKRMEVPVGEHLRLDIFMTPHWWIARGAGNCLDGSTVPVGEHLRLDIFMTPHWWIARGAGNCLDGSTGG